MGYVPVLGMSYRGTNFIERALTRNLFKTNVILREGVGPRKKSAACSNIFTKLLRFRLERLRSYAVNWR